jgi:hypothetical protein
LSLLLLAAPTGAGAATLTLAAPLVSQAECTDRASQEVDATWSFTGSSGSEIELVASDVSGCPDATTTNGATTTVLVEGITASATGSYPGTSASMLYLSDAMAGAGVASTACTATEDSHLYLCARLLDSSGSVTATATARLTLQVTAPPAPVDVTVTPGEGALVVGWSAGAATTDAPAASTTYRVFASAGGATTESAETGDTSIRVKGLEIGTTYDVRVVAYSAAGNPSAASSVVPGTPVNVVDFWEAYGQAGGVERGGCAHGAAGLPALLALAALAVRSRA